MRYSERDLTALYNSFTINECVEHLTNTKIVTFQIPIRDNMSVQVKGAKLRCHKQQRATSFKENWLY